MHLNNLDNDLFASQLLQMKKDNYVYSWCSDASVFNEIVERIANHYKASSITKVVGLESRGFIFGSAVAHKLGAGFVCARKAGKMFVEPRSQLYSREYVDYSGAPKILEVESNPTIISSSDIVLIVDDWIETCNSMKSVISILEQDVRCTIGGVATVYDDSNGQAEKLFDQYNFFRLSISKKK